MVIAKRNSVQVMNTRLSFIDWTLCFLLFANLTGKIWIFPSSHIFVMAVFKKFVFLVGAFSLTEKSPTITESSFFFS